MGKKKKKKNKKSRPYNKKQFVEIFCQSCKLCDVGKDPSFCYIELYKHEPKKFVKFVWENLRDISSYMRTMGKPYSSMSIEQFQNIFCITGLCTNGNSEEGLACERVRDCYEMFRAQMGALSGVTIHQNVNTVRPAIKKGKQSKAQRRRNQKRRYVCSAYPTVIISKDPKFQETVKKILYGDNDNKQDKDQKSTSSSEGSASGRSETGKS
jgi:hypothetical protein